MSFVRKASLDEINRLCKLQGREFFMVDHFVQRINMRAAKQDEAFKLLLVATKRCLSLKFDGQKVSVTVEGDQVDDQPGYHTYLFQLTKNYFDKEVLKGVTYTYRVPTSADRVAKFFDSTQQIVLLKKK